MRCAQRVCLWRLPRARLASPAVNPLARASAPCRAALASTQVLEPRIPVISNVDAQPHSDPDTIKDILARQVLLSRRR